MRLHWEVVLGVSVLGSCIRAVVLGGCIRRLY